MLKLSAVSLQLSDTRVLQDINFALQDGEFIGIIGPNGAGKTSLLRLVQRTLAPSAGQITLQHKALDNYTATELARTVAVVNQTTLPLFALTAEQVAAMGLLPHKSWFEQNTSHDIAIVSRALAKVGLAAKAGQQVDTLSGGELQRLFIARALVQQPRLLLLDEPTNHLDVKYQHQVLQLTQQLGVAVLACLHDLNLAAWYCDKLLLLDQGRQVIFGSPQQVLQPDILQRVFDLPCQIHQQHGQLQVSFMPPAQSGKVAS
ncbi:ABC transporter ATP-binding protein [Rheinheimera muenzenbergensis]|uniref:ABC transporter ATP-binding protein n=1 Tax=Rheinheimera muenzenbergensis TaxID=1193628 RepID=A0ABU8C7W6_9GAMM